MSGSFFGFTGHEHDDELGLINMRGRVFDPASSTFLTQDPFVSQPLHGPAWNGYSYVGHAPTQFTDPSGLTWSDWMDAGDGEHYVRESDSEHGDTDSNGVAGAHMEFRAAPEIDSGSVGKTDSGVAVGRTESGSWHVLVPDTGAWSELGPAFSAQYNRSELVNSGRDVAESAIGGVPAGALAGLVYAARDTATGAVVGRALRLALHIPGVGNALARVSRVFQNGATRRIQQAAAEIPSSAAPAGGFGNWATIDEVSGGAVAQTSTTSCGAACGEMLTGMPQAQIIAEAGAPTPPSLLARVLGLRGGYIGPPNLHAAMSEGPFIGVLHETGNSMGHFVIVDGLDDVGRVMIRDPWAGGSTYRMAMDEFLNVWNGQAVLR
ncbi:MAG: RHS repeat-associated protein [Myxococcota bacterium]|jgi:RHS repeat-associated protein